MRFTEPNLLPALYRTKFLDLVDQIAPEVMRDLKALTPKYEAVFGRNSDWYTSRQLSWLIIESDTEDRCFILQELTGHPRYYTDLDENELTENEQKKLEYVFDLRKSFTDFIERYHLKTEWLKYDLFNLLHDLLNKPEYRHKLAFASTHAFMTESERPLNLYIKGWSMSEDSGEFQRAARAAFDLQLMDYIQTAQARWRSLGYTRYKDRDLDRVKWLVWWTVQCVERSEIIRRIDEDKRTKSERVAEVLREKLSQVTEGLSNAERLRATDEQIEKLRCRQRKVMEKLEKEKRKQDGFVDDSIISKAFAEFRIYGLPVRC